MMLGKPVPALTTLRHIVGEHYAGRLHRELADPKRLEAVYGSKFWTAPDVEKLRQFCQTAAMTLHAPIGQVGLVTDNGQHVVAAVGKPDGQTEELDFSVCQHTMTVGQGLNIRDLREEAMLCDLRVVTESGLRSYLGVPLISRGGEIIGTFCVADFVERDWDEIDVTMLTHLASAIVAMHESGNIRGAINTDNVDGPTDN